MSIVDPGQTLNGVQVWSVVAGAIRDAVRDNPEVLEPINLPSDNQLTAPRAGDLVNRASVIIADLSHPSPLSAALLGMALAQRKQIVLVAQRGSSTLSRRLDLPGVWEYDSLDALAKYLTVRLRFELDLRDTSRPLPDLFDRLGAPVVVLEGDGTYCYTGAAGIETYSVTSDWVFPQRWEPQFEDALARHRQQAQMTGRVFFNGELARLIDYRPRRDERLGLRTLELIVQKTDYHSFVASNQSFDYLTPDDRELLLSEELGASANLRSSSLANPVTLFVNLLVQDVGTEYFVVQRRNTAKIFHARYPYQAGAAGMLSWTRDQQSGRISVAQGALNEVREEVGVSLSPADLDFLGLVRETKNFEIGVLGEVTIRRPLDQLLGPRADSFEASSFEAFEASPSGFCRWIRSKPQSQPMSPLSFAAIVFSLLRRFSPEEVEHHLRASFSRTAL